MNLRTQTAFLQTVIFGIFLVNLATSSPALSGPRGLARSKRHLFQLCSLIARHTNRGCMEFNNYGCYCGLGNAASAAVDSTDECCKTHDNCYGTVSCNWLYPQMVGYNATCSDTGCTCRDSPTEASCEYTTCQCDVQFAECLAQATYNERYSNYNRRECNRPRRRSNNNN